MNNSSTTDSLSVHTSFRSIGAMTFLIGLTFVAIIISFVVGRFTIPLSDFWDALTGHGLGALVLLKVRLPRIAAGMAIGASLAVSGATYQGIFRNPMVSPAILGASSGAGLGAAIAILCSMSFFMVQAMAFTFGVAAVLITYFVGNAVGRNNDSLLSLVLTGIVISALASAIISLTKYLGDPEEKLPEITFWLMGSLSSATVSNMLWMIAPLVVGLVPIIMLRWQLNLLSLGDEEASALGVNVSKVRVILILAATLLTAVSVAVSGVIGWIGLLIPHLARMLVGPNHRVLIPASIFLGGSYLMLVDDLARSLLPMEIPIGILTSLIGAPFFLYLMARRKGL
ncbi:iron chelate uptake ABC transporter family permease subunit [Vibrio sp. CAIM 722]|uniref:Iron chelate uptake ABC transporter family permease subunit n=1 Tax=Vibrio eleionomae TaxID=2653505 RepID=A0A7X4LN34_9VIBR|nr:iron ABC transporter permease [Vibrio eleionomae]MZI95025.1 iron chelate uptake ABC transporter family permease subunit [Vibrio eleionomae]